MESQPQNPEFRINRENFHLLSVPMIDMNSLFANLYL